MWLFESGNESFINFMAAWVKVIMFINGISYEDLKNPDNYENLTNDFFEQEVELND